MICPVAHAPQKIGFGKQMSTIVGYIDPVRVIVKSVHNQMGAECSAACVSPETLALPPPTTYRLKLFLFNNIPTLKS
jgi:hypothetical protein